MSDLPYVIVHMAVTLDGKVTGEAIDNGEADEYAKIGFDYNADAFGLGKTTMITFTGDYYPDLSKFLGKNSLGKKDNIVKYPDGTKLLVVFDRKGSLGWELEKIYNNEFFKKFHGDSRILLVLTEQVKDEYLAYLQSIKLPYIIAGKEEMDLKLALKKLKKEFGVNKLLHCGGPTINESFEKEDLIDEFSLVYFPFLGGKDGKLLCCDAVFREYEFVEHKILPDKNLWVRLKRKK